MTGMVPHEGVVDTERLIQTQATAFRDANGYPDTHGVEVILPDWLYAKFGKKRREMMDEESHVVIRSYGQVYG